MAIGNLVPTISGHLVAPEANPELERLAAEPHAGGVLALDVNARGLPEAMYEQ